MSLDIKPEDAPVIAAAIRLGSWICNAPFSPRARSAIEQLQQALGRLPRVTIPVNLEYGFVFEEGDDVCGLERLWAVSLFVPSKDRGALEIYSIYNPHPRPVLGDDEQLTEAFWDMMDREDGFEWWVGAHPKPHAWDYSRWIREVSDPLSYAGPGRVLRVWVMSDGLYEEIPLPVQPH